MQESPHHNYLVLIFVSQKMASSVLLSPFCLLSRAVQIPAHARVNYQCYPRWNEDHSNLEVVWRGRVWNLPENWTFAVEPNAAEGACVDNSCVQRLWCTESGAVGWYDTGRSPDGNSDGTFSLMHFTWLMAPNVTGVTPLAIECGAAENTQSAESQIRDTDMAEEMVSYSKNNILV